MLSGSHGITGVRTNNDQTGQVVKYTEVRPPEGRNYDCLWDIAERYLGEGRRYKEIYDLNKNKLQPDGRRLTNPDLIMPGWQVRLPADAKGPGVHTVRVEIDARAGAAGRPVDPGEETTRASRPSQDHKPTVDTRTDARGVPGQGQPLDR